MVYRYVCMYVCRHNQVKITDEKCYSLVLIHKHADTGYAHDIACTYMYA